MPLFFKSLLFIVSLSPLLSMASPESDVQLSTKFPAMKFFDIKAACLKMGHPHTLIASPLGISRIDCMGTKVLVTDFCRKEFPDHPKLLRGIITYDQRKVASVTCHFAESAILTVSCSRFSTFCQEAKRGCEQLAPYYAAHHQLLHSGLSTRGEEQVLQCFFSQKDILPDEEILSFPQIPSL